MTLSLWPPVVSNLTEKEAKNANEATGTSNRLRSVAPVFGICTRCVDGCKGNCKIFKTIFRGMEVLYPGPMMNECGIPTFYLQSLVHEFAEKLKDRGTRIPDMAIASGFSSEDGIFKALA